MLIFIEYVLRKQALSCLTYRPISSPAGQVDMTAGDFEAPGDEGLAQFTPERDFSVSKVCAVIISLPNNEAYGQHGVNMLVQFLLVGHSYCHHTHCCLSACSSE